MNFTNDAVYITDLDKCKPNTVFHNNFSKDKWRIIDYETERLSGKMLAASPEAKVPEIYYNLNKKTSGTCIGYQRLRANASKYIFKLTVWISIK